MCGFDDAAASYGPCHSSGPIILSGAGDSYSVLLRSDDDVSEAIPLLIIRIILVSDILAAIMYTRTLTSL